MQPPPPPGTALLEELDKKLLVQLRDGRTLVGVMRSFDQVRRDARREGG